MAKRTVAGSSSAAALENRSETRLVSTATNIGIAVIVLLFVLARQVQKRSVREDGRPVFLLVLLVVGVVEFVQFVKVHPVHATGITMLAASLVVAAAFGVLRARTVRLWREDGVLYRQGNAVTIVLWLVAIGVHFGADVLIDRTGAATGLASASLLLYIAVSFGVQRLVVQSRASSMSRVG
jgi:hypothetical protein